MGLGEEVQIVLVALDRNLVAFGEIGIALSAVCVSSHDVCKLAGLDRFAEPSGMHFHGTAR